MGRTTALGLCPDINPCGWLPFRNARCISPDYIGSRGFFVAYFAAEYVCQNEKKSDIINSIFKSTKFYRNANLFDFIIEKDYALIREHILYSILVNYRNFTNRIKQISLAISNEHAEELASYLFDCEVFATKDSKYLHSGNLFKEVLSVAKKEVFSLRHEEATISNIHHYIFTSTSNTSAVLNMINIKNVDDLLINSRHNKRSEKIVFPIELSWNTSVMNLSSDSIISIQNKEFQIEYLKFLKHISHGPILNYNKAMSILQDIEQLKARKEAENASLF